MFEFIGKEIGIGFMHYHWAIIRNNIRIGTMKLLISPNEMPHVKANFYSDEMIGMTQDDIDNIVNDFKRLIKERLLDIDEDYRSPYFIEVTYTDDIDLYNLFLNY